MLLSHSIRMFTRITNENQIITFMDEVDKRTAIGLLWTASILFKMNYQYQSMRVINFKIWSFE